VAILDLLPWGHCGVKVDGMASEYATLFKEAPMKRTVGEKKWRPFEADQRHVRMVRCAVPPSTAAFQCKATTWKRLGVVARAALKSSDFFSRMAVAT
jgi:hypothetical protein